MRPIFGSADDDCSSPQDEEERSRSCTAITRFSTYAISILHHVLDRDRG